MKLSLALLVLCAGFSLLVWLAAQWRAWKDVKEEIAKIKAGETDALLNLDPAFVDLVTSDPECVKRTRGLLFFEDLLEDHRIVSDPRLAPLGQLPNLNYVVLNNTVGTDLFLKHLQGNEALTRLVLCTTYLTGEAVGDVSGEGIGYIANIPNLNELEMDGAVSWSIDLQPLANHQHSESIVRHYHRALKCRIIL